jgi:diacylglycerol kinase (ATP)
MANKTAGIIINPISGGKDKKPVLEIIRKNFPKHIDYEIIVWERPDQISSIIQKVRDRNYDIVVAAGGDGTVNVVAQNLINTNKQLAIIPLGSGNGLARHLKIPLDTKKAVEFIGSSISNTIDACNVNGNYFFCASGMGYDALVAHSFATSKQRGLWTYLKLSLVNFFGYQPQHYKITVDGMQVETMAFIVSVANASQYGNDAFIAPQAIINDGMMDVVVIKPVPLYLFPVLGIKMFNKTLNTSKHVATYKGKNITVERKTSAPVHYDGEPALMDAVVNYNILQNAVKVIGG